MRGRGWALALALALAVAVPPPAAAQSMPEPGAPIGDRGEVVAVHALPSGPEHDIPGSVEAIGFDYVSVRSDGQPALTSGALHVPAGEPPAGGWPIVAWAHGTTGLGDDCAPTVRGRLPLDIEYLATWLAEGYAVVATDYVGLGTPGVHPYLDGRTAASNVVDSVRAARHLRASLSNRWVVVGWSQGGNAALFANRFAAAEAPELDYRGAVANAPATHVTEQLSLLASPLVPLPDLLGSGSTTYLAYLLAGLRVARPAADVDAYLQPIGRTVLADAERLCFRDMVARMAGVPASAVLAKPIDRPLRAALDSMTKIPTDGHRCPFFVADGVLDLTVPIVNSAALALEMILGLEPMHLGVFPLGDHSSVRFEALPDVLPWVAERFSTPCR